MQNLDLNLLTALHALLQERSVTRAAERLGLTQPTLSGTLAKLRRHFNDELLHPVFAAQPVADPATSTREFVIITSDHGAACSGR